MAGTGNSPELNREAALLSWIQESAPYGIITLDVSFKVQSWNQWMETHSAMRFEDVAGKDLFTLFPDLHERNMQSPLERALKGEYSVLSTALHHHFLPLPSYVPPTGATLMRQTARIAPLILSGTVCGVVVVIDDVTDREAQAEALNEQNRRLEILSWILAQLMMSDAPWKTMRQLFFKIAENMDLDTFLLYLRDPDTGVIYLYTAGGVSPESEKDFADYPLLSKLAVTDDKVIFDLIQERAEPEFAALKKAGARALVAIPLITNGRHLGLLCFATWSREKIAKDESDLLAIIAQYLAVAVDRERTKHQLQKAKEQLLEHAQVLEKRVEERTSRLQDTISELQMFSYTLAHDLKAPVRGMVGYSQILMKNFADSLPPEAMAIVQRLERIPRRMEVLIQDLLEFSKVSRQEVNMVRVEIEPIIDEIVGLRASAVRQAITIRPPLHAVRAQRDLLQQVLSNLVDNAIKFVAPQMTPKITISTEVVTHGSHSIRSGKLLFSSNESAPSKNTEPPPELPPKHVRIWVEDEGIGISSELHQKIFGIFERGADSEKYEGTGMGLAIVARALQRMGGTCGLESEPGRGSRFWIELPAV
ncbi:MAG TPA: ATP-binding protein [Verrucomicrobiae bacterium]|jgi:signal transduction histidine kinase